jgi:hypothetical protein
MAGILNIAFVVQGDALPPEITNITRTPRWPVYGDTVNITATITDLDGIQSAEIIFCDDILCYAPVPMYPTGVDDIWYGNILFKHGTWDNLTWVGYEVKAFDTTGNWTLIDYVYYFYVSEIDLVASIDKNTIDIGESITLNGSAIYNQNQSAPVESKDVTITITAPDLGVKYHNTTTDSNGNFSVTIPFDVHGEYQINVTLIDRTMSAYYETSVMVVDITHLSERVSLTTCYPEENLWVNGTAEYNTNDPVVNSDITVKINDTLTWTGKTDANGDYAILITAPLELGEFTVNVSVTNRSLIHYNETNITVTEIPLPDLVISADDVNVTSAHTPALKGEEIEIVVEIQNLGSAGCSDISIRIYKGPISEGDLIIENNDIQISAGSSATYTLLWTTVNGTYDLWIVLDEADSILETFEDNNNATIQIFVDIDSDEDKIGNSVDLDDDGDDVNDDVDAFPLDPLESVDTDLDGTGNNADVDDDNDGFTDVKEQIEGTDPLDPDTDDDGVNDSLDYAPLDPNVSEEPEESEDSFPWIFLIIIIVIIVVTLLFMLLYGKKKKE